MSSRALRLAFFLSTVLVGSAPAMASASQPGMSGPTAAARPSAPPTSPSERKVVVRYLVGRTTQQHELRADQIPPRANGIMVGAKHYALSSNGITNVMSTGARPQWVMVRRGHGTKVLGPLPERPQKR